jgi:hypothetical protein
MVESHLGDVTSHAPKRRKARGPRSKTGCQTCRIRRVKCDEQKPACHKCTSTGRSCDYEAQSPPTTTPSHTQQPPSPHTIQTVNPQPLPLSLVPIVSHDYQSRRSFAFFHSQTAAQLSGAFESHFWGRLIPQSTHRSPTLWHAAVALGAIHERFLAGDQSVFRCNGDLEQGGFALREYGRAIGCLTEHKGSGRQSADVVLAACIMFACFEVCYPLLLAIIKPTDRCLDYERTSRHSSKSHPKRHQDNSRAPRCWRGRLIKWTHRPKYSAHTHGNTNNPLHPSRHPALRTTARTRREHPHTINYL